MIKQLSFMHIQQDQMWESLKKLAQSTVLCVCDIYNSGWLEEKNTVTQSRSHNTWCALVLIECEAWVRVVLATLRAPQAVLLNWLERRGSNSGSLLLLSGVSIFDAFLFLALPLVPSNSSLLSWRKNKCHIVFIYLNFHLLKLKS